MNKFYGCYVIRIGFDEFIVYIYESEFVVVYVIIGIGFGES